MATDKQREIAREKLDKFIKLAKSKGYREETIKAACIIAGSEQMYDNFGDYPEALDKCYELCEKYDNSGQMLEELLKLSGEDY